MALADLIKNKPMNIGKPLGGAINSAQQKQPMMDSDGGCSCPSCGAKLKLEAIEDNSAEAPPPVEPSGEYGADGKNALAGML